MAEKVNACGVAKHSQQEVGDLIECSEKGSTKYPDHLDARILETTTGKINVAYLT